MLFLKVIIKIKAIGGDYIVVFKLKFNHPNKQATKKLNVNHFSYITKKPEAIYNKNRDFCAFGKVTEIGYNTFGAMNDFTKIKNHISRLSDEKTTIYKCVISLNEDDALEKGYDKRKEWEMLIKRNAEKMAKEMGIKNENFSYVVSLHMKKGHPHVHLMCWDNNQEIQKTVIPKDKINNIRKELTKDIFSNELSLLYKNKEENLKTFKTKTKSELEFKFQKFFGFSNYEEFEKYKEKIMSLDKDMNKGTISNIPNVDESIIKDIFNLKHKINKTGRLNYKFMNPDAKKEIDKITEKLVSSNLELKTSILKYKNSKLDVIKFNKKITDKDNQDIEDEIEAFIGNQILNTYKEIVKNENALKFEKVNEERSTAELNFAKEEIKLSIMILIDDFARKTNCIKNSLKENGRRSLSKKAKVEIRKKLTSKSHINWDLER